MPEGVTNAKSIEAGYFFSMAITPDGTVAGWGDNRFDQITIPSGLSNVVAVSGGLYHSLILTNTPEIPPGQLIAGLIGEVQNSVLTRKQKLKLLDPLQDADKAFADNRSRAAIRDLETFRELVRIFIRPGNHELAKSWLTEAQKIIASAKTQ